MKKEEKEIENEVVLEEDLGKADTEKPGITLSQLGHMVWKHWVGAVICCLVGLAAGVCYSRFIKTPKYQATVQIMVVNSSSESQSSNISLALEKTKIAYGYMTTDEVVKSVGEKLKAKGYDDIYVKDSDGKKTTELDLGEIKELYTVTIPTVTTNSTSVFLSVTSTCKSEDLAVDVVNFVVSSTIDLANSSSSSINAMLNNSLISMGSASSAKDTSTSTAVFGIVGTLAGLVIGAAYGIVRELANTKVSSKADLEALTGYKVIGMIPRYGAPGGGEITKKGGNKHE